MIRCANCNSYDKIKARVSFWVNPNLGVREQLKDKSKKFVFVMEDEYYCGCNPHKLADIIDDDEIQLDKDGFVVNPE